MEAEEFWSLVGHGRGAQTVDIVVPNAEGVGLFCGEAVTKVGLFGCVGERLGSMMFALAEGYWGPVIGRENWVWWGVGRCGVGDVG